jgi:hypothetical protein
MLLHADGEVTLEYATMGGEEASVVEAKLGTVASKCLQKAGRSSQRAELSADTATVTAHTAGLPGRHCAVQECLGDLQTCHENAQETSKLTTGAQCSSTSADTASIISRNDTRDNHGSSAALRDPKAKKTRADM